MPQKTNDPQIVVKTRVRTATASGGELITFSLRLGWWELVAIVPIPDEGQTEGKAYCKFKVLNPEREHRNHNEHSETEETQAVAG
jgi:hypothetical protein